MSVTIGELLQPQVILDMVSRIRKKRARAGQFFGFHVGPNSFDKENMELRGPNTKLTPTRVGSYEIYDHTRTIATGRAPGTGPATYQANPIGIVDYCCARFHEKLRLLAEKLANMAKVFGPNSVIDNEGQDYVAEQIMTMTERMDNVIEILTWGMIRGTIYLKQQGDNWIPVLTDPGAVSKITINFQVPSGNLAQLNMLAAGSIIDVSWDNAAANIVNHLLQIDRAFVRLTGDSLKHIWIPNTIWQYILANTQVKALAGTANTPYADYERVKERGFDGAEISEYTAVLRACPQFIFHITNEVLVVDGGTDPSYASGTGTLGAMIDDTCALFCPEPSSDWVDFLYCPEYISEQPGQPMIQKTGYSFWKEWATQPTAVELVSLFNGIPRLRRPNNIAYGTVKF